MAPVLLGPAPYFSTKKYDMFRTATAQGKQGIWMLTFPDRENTGDLVNLIFYTGKIVTTQGKFRISLKILLFKWQQGDGAFLC